MEPLKSSQILERSWKSLKNSQRILEGSSKFAPRFISKNPGRIVKSCRSFNSKNLKNIFPKKILKILKKNPNRILSSCLNFVSKIPKTRIRIIKDPGKSQNIPVSHSKESCNRSCGRSRHHNANSNETTAPSQSPNIKQLANDPSPPPPPPWKSRTADPRTRSTLRDELTMVSSMS